MSQDEQLRCLLALLRIPRFGPIKIGDLLEKYADLTSLFNSNGHCVLSSRSEPLEVDWAGVESDLKWAKGANCYILRKEDPTYPPLLKEIHASPPVLFVHGQLEFLTKPQLAIVGSRNPTPLGNDLAKQFAQYLSSVGLTITSGLAIGVDAAAHRGALREKGGTVAVLGSGLNQIYPHQHVSLAEQIVANGVLVSEFPTNTRALPAHFPRRNRLISGLSMGCLVVEAALKSGSLITAKYALDQGREVFAMPGSIHSPLAKGCHQLLRQGAKLVETAQDVLEELGTLFNLTAELLYKQDNQLRTLGGKKGFLLKKMHQGACTSVDDLVQLSGLTVENVSSMLLELELDGQVISVPGGYWRV